MTCRESFYRLLSSLKLYRLGCKSLIDAEIESYLAGFEMVEQSLRDLWHSAFIMTSDSQQLSRFERLLGLCVNTDLPLENRRLMALWRMSVGPNDFHEEGILQAIRSAGLDAELVCSPPHQVTIKGLRFLGDFSSLDEIARAIDAFLPAHLDVVLDVGLMTWQDFDGLDKTWQQLDEMDLTFQSFDLGNLLPKTGV